MIRLDRIELLHWDMQPHQVLPLAHGLTLLTGENGSGKTSVLDAIKVALGVTKLGGDREIARYLAKQARSVAMVRVVADNRVRPGTRQRPFDRLGEFNADLVTLAVVFRAQDEAEYTYEYYLLDGDVVPPVEPGKRTAKALPGPSDYRQRLAKVGLTERYLKLLSLPQGQIASLCKKEPTALFDDLYDVIGGRQTLEAWERRLKELRETQSQYEAVGKELDDARVRLQALQSRVRRHEDWRAEASRRAAIEDALPHVEIRDGRLRVERLRDQVQRLSVEIDGFVRAQQAATAAATVARSSIIEKETRRDTLKAELARLTEERNRVYQQLANERAEFTGLERVRQKAEGIAWEDMARLAEDAGKIRARRASLQADADRRQLEREQATAQVRQIEQGILPLPPEVERFRARLKTEGVAHHLLHEVVDLEDPAWQNAIEGYLGRYRFAVLVGDLRTWSRAATLAQEERYPHGVLAPDVRGSSPQDDAGIFQRVSVQNPDYRPLVARLLRSVVAGDPPQPIEPTRVAALLSQSGFLVSRLEARHVWTDRIYFGREALHRRAEEVKRRLEELDREDAASRGTDQELEQAALQLETRIGQQQALREWQAVQRHHADLDTAIAERSENVDRRDEVIAAKAAERDQLVDALMLLTGTASSEEATAKTNGDQAAASTSKRQELEGDRDAAEKALGTLLAASLPPLSEGVKAVLGGGESATTLKAQKAELDGRALRFTPDERDPMLPINYERQSAEVGAVEERLGKLAASVEMTKQAADRAHEEYQHTTRLLFRAYFARLKRDAEQLGYRVDGELVNAASGKFACEMRVGIDQKPPVNYASSDLSGGQRAALSILMSMTAVSLDTSESAGFFLVDEPFSESDVYKINELGEFLARTKSQYLISMPTSSDVSQCGDWLSATWTSTKSPGGFASGKPVLAPPIKLGFAVGARDG